MTEGCTCAGVMREMMRLPERTNTYNKFYACGYCGSEFVKEYDFEQHMYVKHDVVITNPAAWLLPTEIPFTHLYACLYCHYHTRNEDKILAHAAAKHSQELDKMYKMLHVVFNIPNSVVNVQPSGINSNCNMQLTSTPPVSVISVPDNTPVLGNSPSSGTSVGSVGSLDQPPPLVYIAGRAVNDQDACCEDAWGSAISKSLIGCELSEEVYVPRCDNLVSMSMIGGYLMHLHGSYPEIKHLVRFSQVPGIGQYNVIAYEGGNFLAHAHVVGHQSRPHGTVAATADIFSFNPIKKYECTIEIASALGPGTYKLQSVGNDNELVMIIDWGWRHFPTKQLMPVLQ